ncbi:MAG: hypothetical protein QXK37_01515 [Candidatus Woesearchaeota archaeon]
MAVKKGFFFTLTAMVFLVLLFLYISLDYQTRLRDKAIVIDSRVTTLDHFVDDLEKDIERGVYIASFRSLLAIQQYITSKGEFLYDTDDVIEEIIINGTINGEYMSVMNDTQLSIWVERIRVEAVKTGIYFNYTLNDISISHSDPWTLTISLDVTEYIQDRNGLAYWSRNKRINTSLSIVGFEDPLYTVNTFGRVINTIEKSSITDFVGPNNDTTNLLYHLDNSLYIDSQSAPSYLMRLKGDLNSSPYGIESLVNLIELEANDINTLNKSCIDYIYFSKESPEHYLIKNTYNWFRLDNESGHLARYEVEELIE